MKRAVLVVAALLMAATPALAQTSGPDVAIVDINGSRYPDGGQTTMVLEFRDLTTPPDPAAVEVTVNGEAVSDLEVVRLADSTIPTGVVLTIDSSGSMSGAPLEAAKAAAKGFVSQMRPGDRIAIVTFADETNVVAGFTNNVEVLNSRIDAIEANGETAFNDAVITSVGLFEADSASNLLANVIVLTDGDDTVSTATLDEAVAAVEGSDARVFGVALESPDFNPGPVEQVAAAGDGLFLSTPDPEQLSELYDEISREISNTLVARFISPVSTPGEAAFAVSYEGLSATTTFAVSGYAVTTTTSPGPTTTTTLAPVSSFVVEANSPLDLRNLSLMASAGIGLTLFLFIVIVFGRDEEDDPGRFARRLQAYGARVGSGGDTEEKTPLLQRIPLLKKFSQAAEEEVRRRGMLSGVNSTLEQANIALTAGEAVISMLGLAAVGGVFATIFNGPVWGAGIFGGLIVLMALMIKIAGSREKAKFEKQLPDTLTLMSTSLRAGYSLLQATEAVAAESPNPTAREFGRAMSEARLGRSVNDSLNGIVERTQSDDFQWAVMAIEIQREVGGNLAEVLQTVADTMRARNRLKGEIRALTAEGRISAIVLGSLPFFVFGFLWFTNPGYLQPLLDSTFGQMAIGAGLLLMAGGILWLRKIVDIEI